MRNSKAISGRNLGWTIDSSGAIFTVLLAVGLMLGSYAVAVDGELGRATTAVVMDGYRVRLTGALYDIVAEYVWQLLILLSFIFVCLSSRKGEFLACGIPFLSGVQIGAVLTALTASMSKTAMFTLVISVYIPSMLRAVALLFIFTALRARCVLINRGTEIARTVSITVGLMIYTALLFVEILIFITILR